VFLCFGGDKTFVHSWLKDSKDSKIQRFTAEGADSKIQEFKDSKNSIPLKRVQDSKNILWFFVLPCFGGKKHSCICGEKIQKIQKFKDSKD